MHKLAGRGSTTLMIPVRRWPRPPASTMAIGTRSSAFIRPAAARARIQELEAEKATIDAQLRWLTSNFQQMFNDPQFKIFGETTAQQIRTLAGGILNLNLAEKQALYLSLGGQPAPN